MSEGTHFWIELGSDLSGLRAAWARFFSLPAHEKSKSCTLGSLDLSSVQMSIKSPTDAERDGRLIAATLADPSEYRHLVTLYQNRVFATALRISGNASDAKDASQEAFLRAFKALERFEIGRSFGPWICTIAANVSRDQLRDPLRRLARVAEWFSDKDDSATSLLDRQKSPARADVTVDLAETRDYLAEALLKLKPKVREAVVLRFVSGLSIDEIAIALNVGESAVKMRIKRGLEQLRDEVDPAHVRLLLEQ